MTKGKTKPQTTVVHVAVTTAGPEPMKAVREAVSKELGDMVGWPVYFPIDVGTFKVTKVHVKRDADIQSPRG